MATKSGSQPAYKRVLNELRADILGKKYASDTPLPTEHQLAARHHVSRQTVRRAFQDLVSEDLVYRVRGRGTFVKTDRRYIRQVGSIEDLLALSEDSQMRVTRGLSSTVDLAASTRLRLTDDRVSRVDFVRLHELEVISHTSVFLPPSIRSSVAASETLTTIGTESTATVIGLIESSPLLSIVEAEQSITVVDDVPAEVAHNLEVGPGTAVMRIDRTYYDEAGDPVELAISHYHPDRFSYRVRLRRSR